MSVESQWGPIADAGGYLAPAGDVVWTKIHDESGERNVALLRRSGNLWFFPDGSMYVYYTPTHWKPLIDEPPRSGISKRAI